MARGTPKKEASDTEAAESSGPVLVVLRPGWLRDPYRGAGGVVIPSATPTEVSKEQAAYLLATFPDAFTVQK